MPNTSTGQPESSVPTPLFVVLGLVATGADEVRALPGRAARLPVRIPLLTLSAAWTASETLRREYDDLAVRGQALLERLRGRTTESGEAALDGAQGLVEAGRSMADAARDEARHGLQLAGELAQPAAAGSPMAEPSPALDLADAAVTPQVRETVAEVVARVGDENADGVPDGAVLDHAELPLSDYDHLTLGSLRGRLRSFDLRDLVLLRDYEKAHANRLSVVTMFDNRIAKLAADA